MTRAESLSSADFTINSANIVDRVEPRFRGFAATIAQAVEDASLDVTNHDLFPNAIFARENAAHAPIYVREIAARIINQLREEAKPTKRQLMDGAVEYFSQVAENLVDKRSSHVAAGQVRSRMIDMAVLVVARTQVSDGPTPTTTWSTRAVLDSIRGLCQDAMIEERQKRNAARIQPSTV